MKQINLAAAFGLLLAFVALGFLVLKGEPATAQKATWSLMAAAGALIAALSGKLLTPLGQSPPSPPPSVQGAPSLPSTPSEPSRSSDGSWPPPGVP